MNEQNTRSPVMDLQVTWLVLGLMLLPGLAWWLAQVPVVVKIQEQVQVLGLLLVLVLMLARLLLCLLTLLLALELLRRLMIIEQAGTVLRNLKTLPYRALPEEVRAEESVLYHRLKRSNLPCWQVRLHMASEYTVLYFNLIRVAWDNLVLWLKSSID